MGLKKSIQLSDQAVAYIEARRSRDTDDQDVLSWSAGVNQALADLSWLLRELVPELQIDTWRILLDAYAGHYFDGPRLSPHRLASDVMDHYGAIELGQVPPEVQSAVRELHDLTQPQQHAALEVNRLFWTQSNRWTGSLADRIEQIKKAL